MAKFNIEVELDWMEEDSYSIDEELKKKIVGGVKRQSIKQSINLSKMYALKRLIIFRFLKNQVIGVIKSHIIHYPNM